MVTIPNDPVARAQMVEAFQEQVAVVQTDLLAVHAHHRRTQPVVILAVADIQNAALHVAELQLEDRRYAVDLLRRLVDFCERLPSLSDAPVGTVQ